MLSTNYILVDDSAISIGGTELSLMGILEKNIENVLSIKSSDLNIDHINKFKDKIWIFGNIVSLYSNPNFTDIINNLSTIKFVKIEFDYNFCVYRGEYPHKKFANQQCACPYGIGSHELCGKLYDALYTNAKHIFFMSEKQRAIYSTHISYFDFSKSSILSSCFTIDSLNEFEALKNNPKNNKYAILDGYGGWHSEAKGREVAKEFCKANNIEYDILPTQSYENHLKLLSSYKGLIFFPIIHDTCPRCIIEAKLMNLDVITNLNSQHITEYWWKDADTIKTYLKSRPEHFWNIINNLCSQS